MSATKRAKRSRERTYTAVVTETTTTVVRFKAGSTRAAVAEACRIEQYARQRIESLPAWRLLKPRRNVEVDLGPLPD